MVTVVPNALLRSERQVCSRGAWALLGVLLLAGCSGGPEAVTGPYAERIEAARAQATSAFEREALADGEVSREEYEEAVQRFLACAAEQDILVEVEDQAGYYIYSSKAEPDDFDRVYGVCAPGTVGILAGLYTDMLVNPTNGDPDTVTASCFVRAGLVTEPFTAVDFRDLLIRSGASDGSGGTGQVRIDPEAQRVMGTDEAHTCMANPASFPSE